MISRSYNEMFVHNVHHVGVLYVHNDLLLVVLNVHSGLLGNLKKEGNRTFFKLFKIRISMQPDYVVNHRVDIDRGSFFYFIVLFTF